MKIASWNVNSLPVRLPQVLEWLVAHSPDILCLQETKVPDDRFPIDPLRDSGYHVLFRGQPTYNGVAILSRVPPVDPLRTLCGPVETECRFLSARFGPVQVVNCYVPNGQDLGTEKFAYKLSWLQALAAYLEVERGRSEHIVVTGDFNITPEDRDVCDPVGMKGQIFLSEEERSLFRAILALGFDDSFRLGTPEAGHYSWWDYRAGMFRRNLGLRIDLLLTSHSLRPRFAGGGIDRSVRKHERPSDHVPVWVDLDF